MIPGPRGPLAAKPVLLTHHLQVQMSVAEVIHHPHQVVMTIIMTIDLGDLGMMIQIRLCEIRQRTTRLTPMKKGPPLATLKLRDLLIVLRCQRKTKNCLGNIVTSKMRWKINNLLNLCADWIK